MTLPPNPHLGPGLDPRFRKWVVDWDEELGGREYGRVTISVRCHVDDVESALDYLLTNVSFTSERVCLRDPFTGRPLP